MRCIWSFAIVEVHPPFSRPKYTSSDDTIFLCFLSAGAALCASRPTSNHFAPLPSAFVLVQKSIVEFLTSAQHAQDPLHRRLFNPLSAEFGVYKRQDLDYMIQTGFPHQKLVRCFKYVHSEFFFVSARRPFTGKPEFLFVHPRHPFMGEPGNSGREERGAGWDFRCRGPLWWLALEKVATSKHVLRFFPCHAPVFAMLPSFCVRHCCVAYF